MCIYIYIYRERERDTLAEGGLRVAADELCSEDGSDLRKLAEIPVSDK